MDRYIMLHLSLIKGVGDSTIAHLLRRGQAFEHLTDYRSLRVKDYVGCFGCSQKQAERIVKGLSNKRLLEDELALLEQYNIDFVSLADGHYPDLLRHIHCPPSILYAKGDLSILKCKGIAFVGSRKATQYSEKIIKIFLPPILKQNWTIISGGAYGADSMAHRQTIALGGKTIVVLGSGLLRYYPRVHTALFSEIIASGGLLVSPFSLETDPAAYHFPVRNRIISGLSQAIVITQAAKKSGTAITAQWALDQGKTVCVVPGLYDDALSQGCHALIKQGAALVTSAYDIFRELHVTVSQTEESDILQTREKQKEGIEALKQKHPMLAWCVSPKTTDELVVCTKRPLEEVSSELFDLQLLGIIEQNMAGKWVFCK